VLWYAVIPVPRDVAVAVFARGTPFKTGGSITLGADMDGQLSDSALLPVHELRAQQG
jgi:hypothetical protein